MASKTDTSQRNLEQRAQGTKAGSDSFHLRRGFREVSKKGTVFQPGRLHKRAGEGCGSECRLAYASAWEPEEFRGARCSREVERKDAEAGAWSSQEP